MPSKNLGVRKVEEVTFDVTSLTNANNEPLTSWTNQSDIDDVDSATVVGHDKAATYTAQVDHSQDAVVFATISDGTDPTASADVGEVKLRLEGRR
jgi:hypothetical protein